MKKGEVFKVWVVKYWLTEGVYESYATDGGSSTNYVFLCDAKGENVMFQSMRKGRDVVVTKKQVEERVHALAGKKMASLNKQIAKVLERAKNPWKDRGR